MTFRRAIKQSNYDSVLDPAQSSRPATLTIRLKVALYPRDPSVPYSDNSVQPPPTHLSVVNFHHGQVQDDYNESPVNCRSWITPEWNLFKIRFKRVVENAWNNQIFLLPPESGGLSDEDYRQLVSNPQVQAHVECALDIELLPIGVPAHALIEVVHLATAGDHFRNWMQRISNKSVEFTTHMNDRWPGEVFHQVPAAHEVGHWLRDLTPDANFEHIDAAYAETLPAAQAAKAQYGRTLGRRVAMMGSGNLATEYEARPWLERIRRHTLMIGWTMIHRIHFDKIRYQVADRQRLLVSGSPTR